MERNHMVANYSPSSRNQTLVAQARAELMFSELGVAAGDLRNGVDREETSVLEHLAATLRPKKWTNEKHGLFLKSMEASFVHQLHDSIDTLGWSSKKNPFDHSNQEHIGNHNSSGQVFREGWRGKINFRREEVEMKKEDDSSGAEEITSNPWISRYKSDCRQHRRREDLALTIDFPASAFYVRHRPRVSSKRASSAQSLEVTDQNFIDEDVKDGDCEIQSSKRIKTEPFY